MKMTFKKGKLTLKKDGEPLAEKDAKERKRNFFVDFFANFGMATLISYGAVYIYLPALGGTFFLPLQNFFTANMQERISRSDKPICLANSNIGKITFVNIFLFLVKY